MDTDPDPWSGSTPKFNQKFCWSARCQLYLKISLANPFARFWAKLLTDRQTDKQRRLHILLGGGNDKYQLLLMNPRDALHHGKSAADKGGDQCDKLATELSWQRLRRSTFSSYSELFVESRHQFYPIPPAFYTSVGSDPFWLLPSEIFGVRELLSMGYRAALFASSYASPFVRFSRTPTCDRQTHDYGIYRDSMTSRGKKYCYSDTKDCNIVCSTEYEMYYNSNCNTFCDKDLTFYYLQLYKTKFNDHR